MKGAYNKTKLLAEAPPLSIRVVNALGAPVTMHFYRMRRAKKYRVYVTNPYCAYRWDPVPTQQHLLVEFVVVNLQIRRWRLLGEVPI